MRTTSLTRLAMRAHKTCIEGEHVAPETNTAAVVRRLKQEGWTLDRHGANHDVYVHQTLDGVIAVPRHRSLSPGVARSIARTAGWF